MKGTLVLGAAIGLLTLLGGVAVAASTGPASGPGNPDPEDCEDLQDQLAALTAARYDLQQSRAAILAQASQLPLGTDEELLAQVAAIDNQLAIINKKINSTQVELTKCGG